VSDVHFQKSNLLNIVVVISRKSEFGQVEESRHHVSHLLNSSGKLVQAVDELQRKCRLVLKSA